MKFTTTTYDARNKAQGSGGGVVQRRRKAARMRSMIRVVLLSGLEATFAFSEEELDLFSLVT